MLCRTVEPWDTGTVVLRDSGRYRRVRGDEGKLSARFSDWREEVRAEFGNLRV